MYGATGGSLYAAGRAGERLCVRNSGGKAVVEGCGNHGCEYMTGGVVAVLGATGRNFGAGMSGGVAYVYDPDGLFPSRYNPGMVTVGRVTGGVDEDLLQALVSRHAELTGSVRAQGLLNDWNRALTAFWRVAPHPSSEDASAEEQDLRAHELAALGRAPPRVRVGNAAVGELKQEKVGRKKEKVASVFIFPLAPHRFLLFSRPRLRVAWGGLESPHSPPPLRPGIFIKRHLHVGAAVAGSHAALFLEADFLERGLRAQVVAEGAQSHLIQSQGVKGVLEQRRNRLGTVTPPPVRFLADDNSKRRRAVTDVVQLHRADVAALLVEDAEGFAVGPPTVGAQYPLEEPQGHPVGRRAV